MGTTDTVAGGLRPILIVTGLPQETRVAAGPGVTVICSGSDPQQLRRRLRACDPATLRSVVSFGIAGGLDPSLNPGDVVIATEVVAGDSRWTASMSALELAATTALGSRRVTRGVLAGSERVIFTTEGKAQLRRSTGAAAVDMESHIAADYASTHGLPFGALRAVADPATRALPAVGLDAINPDGQIDVWKVLRGVARHPHAIPDLLRVARDFNRALAGLRGCRSLLLAGDAQGLVAADL